MSDSSDDGIPAWQRTPQRSGGTTPDVEATPAASTDSGSSTTEDKLTIARRFLDDEMVKNKSRDKKAVFLKSKGVEDGHIQKLLGDAPETATEEETDNVSPTPQKRIPAITATDRAPIVTYPEFLTKPQRPPPLVTRQGLLNTLYGFTGLSTLIYGASKFVAEPMLGNLNVARQELHDTTASRLKALVNQLERTVSVVPPPKHAALVNKPTPSLATTMVSDEEDDEDPTEMFHRDIGTQTSFSDALASAAEDAKNPGLKQATTLDHTTSVTKLAKCFSGLRDAVVSQCGDFEDIKAQVEHFREDLDRMIFPHMDFTPGGYGMMSTAGSNIEPDDEVRKARDNIRRIKGVLLSTRSFPASTR
ncbi:peroxin Pex14/17-Penicillium chrysogenum [Cordyceps militaris CM01]|uniref:Peroxin Pex14/17-Penicillium chrysogenum n=2 Tax=Cordyceps militaris TaxID=73501 RepID=G3JNA6_CORMM|nr:peroxin Pex14/17-Penicillium chrysogenum [Cordyceps militaris CM01]ATY63160.1 peroxin Pex14 17-Penicillium chrysogenum [Cordyceps militaris]EGX90288.1 peroxin Pex14/17-Penicillium chrysogenum [Cordyceps militaris CM01]